jgi:glycosyltransferase involved in cell wall biosynthesis
MEKLSVAILGTRGTPARYGGFETFAEHLSLGLAQQGHEVYVYCPKYQAYKESTYQGVHLIFVSNFEYLFKDRIPRAVCNLFYDIACLVHACRQTGAKNVYMLGYSAGPFLVLPRLFGKKLIVNPDGLEWKSTRWGYFARSWLYFCEFISAHCSNYLIGDAQPITDRFATIYNAPVSTIEYGTELFEDDGQNLEYLKGTYYLAVARMVPETKIDVIIEGFKRAKLGNRKLIIVGRSPTNLFLNLAYCHIPVKTILNTWAPFTTRFALRSCVPTPWPCSMAMPATAQILLCSSPWDAPRPSSRLTASPMRRYSPAIMRFILKMKILWHQRLSSLSLCRSLKDTQWEC